MIAKSDAAAFNGSAHSTGFTVDIPADLKSITRDAIESAVAHLVASAVIWSQRGIYGELGITLKFTSGVGVQWEGTMREIHRPQGKSGLEAGAAGAASPAGPAVGN